jgi:hypothetical protein
MLRPLLFTAALAAICTAAVAQETATVPPPPVESMNCDQMLAELTVAGQRMSAQLDPEFASEAQAMHDEAQQGQNSAMAQGVGTSIACSIPGIGMACMAAQQAQAARAQQQQQQHMERMDAQMSRLNASMEGIDQQRMMALSQRYEQLGCQAPQ